MINEFFHVFMHFLIVLSLVILVFEVYLLKNKRKEQTGIQAESHNPPLRFEPLDEISDARKKKETK